MTDRLEYYKMARDRQARIIKLQQELEEKKEQVRTVREELEKAKRPWGERFYYVAARRSRGDAPKIVKSAGRIYFTLKPALEAAEDLNREYGLDNVFRVFQALACDMKPPEHEETEE